MVLTICNFSHMPYTVYPETCSHTKHCQPMMVKHKYFTLILTDTRYNTELTAPAFALTTSVPAFCILSVREAISSSVKEACGVTCKNSHNKRKCTLYYNTLDNRGSMVTPECPPITGTLTDLTSKFFNSATNVFALTTSNVLTPIILQQKDKIIMITNNN